MAYNFKNALVNLNEEIRKSGGGGGSDLPAVKLAVSQLQVSMAAVKSSLSAVSSDVATIKATLESLQTYGSSIVTIGKSGTNDVKRWTITFEGGQKSISPNSWLDTGISAADVKQFRSAFAYSANGSVFPVIAAITTGGNLQLQAGRTSNITADGVFIEYEAVAQE